MQFNFNRLLYYGSLLFFLVLTVGIVSADDVNISLVGHFSGSIYDVVVAGNYAYVGNGGDFEVLDISDSSNPSYIGSYYGDSRVMGLAISANYVYASASYDGLAIFDVSNHSSPKRAGSCDTYGWADKVAVSGNYAYVADSHSGLVIVDVSNLTAPKIVYAGGDPKNDVVVSGNYAYVADDNNGLFIIEISNPATPKLVGFSDTAGKARGVVVSGNYAYVAADKNGLVIIEISNPDAPKLVGSYDTAGSASDIVVSGNYAYVADGNNGLLIIDINNPASPKFAGGYDTADYARGVAVSDNYVYVADGQNGLVILKTNIQNKDREPELASIGNKAVNETESLSFTISATDSDGDTISYSATDLPTGATLNTTSGFFSWTPASRTAGNYSVTFTAIANGQSDSETIKITVLADDWNPWNDLGSDGGESIYLSELQTAIYDWRFGVTLPTGELIDLSRLQSLIYQWRFG